MPEEIAAATTPAAQTPPPPAPPAAEEVSFDSIVDSTVAQRTSATETPAPAAAPATPAVPTAAAPAPVAPAAPTWRDAVLDGEDVPQNFRGKKTTDVVLSWAEAQDALARERSRADSTAAELRKLQIAQEVRTALAEATPAPATAAPTEDPREEQIQQLMLVGDYGEARRLMREIDDERHQAELKQTLATERARMENESAQREDRRQMDYAYRTAMSSLIASGVPQDRLTPQNVTALYAALTMPSRPEAPNPYLDAGGPRNPEAIIALWHSLFGKPAGAAATLAVVPPPPPAAMTGAVPGAGRPAAAVPPSGESASPMRQEMVDVLESIAKERKFDPADMINTARAEHGAPRQRRTRAGA